MVYTASPSMEWPDHFEILESWAIKPVYNALPISTSLQDWAKYAQKNPDFNTIFPENSF